MKKKVLIGIIAATLSFPTTAWSQDAYCPGSFWHDCGVQWTSGQWWDGWYRYLAEGMRRVGSSLEFGFWDR